MQCYFGLASPFQIKQLFQRFYTNVSEELTDAFVEKIPPDTLSMAELQNYFLGHKDDPQSAIDHAEEFVKGITSSSTRRLQVR